jgi:seryl-tRNA synthetase
VYAKELGSDGEVVTDITVGLNTSLEKRKRKIEEAMAIVPPKFNEVLKNISSLSEMKKQEGKDFSEEKAKKLADLNKLMPQLMDRNNQLTELEEQLNEDLDKAADECIYVLNTLYPGVKVTIGKAVRVVANEEHTVVVEFNRKKQLILIRSMSSDEKEECQI